MTIYGNREPNGCAGCLVLLAFFAVASYVVWEFVSWVFRAVAS